ncbi:glycine cleavage system protein GcvH [Halocalculus aciditolerans]|uniref:Probable glycine cleavage system H protein n=1 Tax=Halocalculus aciditolerans TaxID=1383812 RepID=A0A830FGB2_9EURY|nr:glycine cleavage system protein GcvH [Halocalculus aciditolerans]GGL52395.1 glycine cleavage system protein H [Halocalculus aciditolerans]
MFDVPDDCYYLESHEWYRPADGRVGITDFAQDELGDVVFVELPDDGDELTVDDQFGVVESIKAVSDLYSPVSGTVADTNDTLHDKPELVNDDPFGDGWMLELDDVPEDTVDALLTPEEYREQIE